MSKYIYDINKYAFAIIIAIIILVFLLYASATFGKDYYIASKKSEAQLIIERLDSVYSCCHCYPNGIDRLIPARIIESDFIYYTDENNSEYYLGISVYFDEYHEYSSQSKKWTIWKD